MNTTAFLEAHLVSLVLNYSNQSVRTNVTQQTPLVPKWTSWPISSLLVFVLSFIGNGTLLLLFAKSRSLRTPFNIYIINLIVTNLACLMIQYPLDIVNGLYGFAWILGEKVCTVYLYAQWILQAVTCTSHMVIAFNRIWAVCYPASYRAVHSKRIASFLCFGAWIFIHVTLCPGWVMDALYYRLPVETNGCLLNTEAQLTWDFIIQFMVFRPPLLSMIVSLLVILCAKYRRRKVKLRRNTITPVNVVNFLKSECDSATATNIQMARIPNNRNVAEDNKEFKVVKENLHSVSTAVTSVTKVDRSKHSRGTLVLALLTISVTICWTPTYIFYTLALFIEVYTWVTFWVYATIMDSFQMVLDPILFILALPTLRTALRAFIRGKPYMGA